MWVLGVPQTLLVNGPFCAGGVLRGDVRFGGGVAEGLQEVRHVIDAHGELHERASIDDEKREIAWRKTDVVGPFSAQECD